MMSTFFKIIRPLNLLIVAITQLVLYYKCVYPYFNSISSLTPVLTDNNLILFIVTTVLITMGGNIINDFFDIESDAINGKLKSKELSKSKLVAYYVSTTIIGGLISIYLAMVTDNLKLLWLYPFAVTLLFYYSKDWKAMGLFGNLVVAFFCCMVPGMILVAEYPILEHLSRPLYGHLSGIDIIIYYILFSFFSTLYREIVKDMEDIEGDKKVAYATLPIKIGLDKTKTFAQFQGIILLILLVIWGFVSWTNISIYASIFLLFSCFTFTVYTLAVIPKANDKVAFHKINNQIKLIMLSGLVYLALI